MQSKNSQPIIPTYVADKVYRNGESIGRCQASQCNKSVFKGSKGEKMWNIQAKGKWLLIEVMRHHKKTVGANNDDLIMQLLENRVPFGGQNF